MNSVYERDLDLNLLRVFVVVAEAGSVTAAAQRLYLTQPAVSAALGRLARNVGQPLFARVGRGLALTARGSQLLAAARPHLAGLVSAALSPVGFDPKTSEEIVRIGLSDASEAWLLAPLLKALDKKAPRLRIVVLPIQFRTVSEALLGGRVDFAVTVADELPAGMRRLSLFHSGFVCLYDPRQVRLPKRPSVERYLAEQHVVVSYAGDLRGVVEDEFGLYRRVRISVPSFQSVGAAVSGTSLLATVPEMVARDVLRSHPRLRTAVLPFQFPAIPLELIWGIAQEDAGAQKFVRDLVAEIAKRLDQ